MTNPNAFDTYAQDYDATVQSAINISGESVRFFADLKAIHAATHAPDDTRRVLDFGCGIGNATRALAERFPAARVVGTDPSIESLEVARRVSANDRGAPRMEYALSGMALPFDDGSFDLAFTACVFHHIDPQARLRWARELRRVVRPGGRMILFEHNPRNPLTRRVVEAVPFDEGVQLLRAGEARELVRTAGFRVLTRRYYFFFPHVLGALRVLEPALAWVPWGAQYFVLGEVPGP